MVDVVFAGEFTGYSRRTVGRWIRMGKLKALILPQKYVIPKCCLIDWLCSKEHNDTIRKSCRHVDMLRELSKWHGGNCRTIKFQIELQWPSLLFTDKSEYSPKILSGRAKSEFWTLTACAHPRIISIYPPKLFLFISSSAFIFFYLQYSFCRKYLRWFCHYYC